MKLSKIVVYSIAAAHCWGTIIPHQILPLVQPPTVKSSYLNSLFNEFVSYFYPSYSEVDELEDWISREKNISFHRMINNIGGLSSTLAGTAVEPGVVIASPSTSFPNYFYQWVRDLAITIKTLLYYLDDMPPAEFQQQTEIINVIETFIENNYKLQRLDNLSGTFNDDDKSGLGEPKFNVDNTIFDEGWGRPQRDGPGLRATTIMYYLRLLDKFNSPIQSTILKSPRFVYFKVIRPDLVYIVRNWEKHGFDLWEEVNAIHFFTSITQLKAIKDGIQFAHQFADYEFQSQLETTFDQLNLAIISQQKFGFTTSTLGHLIECPHLYHTHQRSGLDAATLLGAIHAHDHDHENYHDHDHDHDHPDSPTIPFDIDNPYVMNTLVAMVNDMKMRYPINHSKIGMLGVGVGIGRYPEDIYDGVHTSEGNPWFIATATGLELVYRFIHKYLVLELDIVITTANRDFFNQFGIVDEDGTGGDGNGGGNGNGMVVIEHGSLGYAKLMQQLAKYADSFLAVIKTHVDAEGRMSEQFNKYTGYMQGAKELTWSYSAFWNAVRWREKTMLVM